MPDGWPTIQALILLAFHDDTDVASLACMELIDRIDLPAIPLVHNDRCKVVRKASHTVVGSPPPPAT